MCLPQHLLRMTLEVYMQHKSNLLVYNSLGQIWFPSEKMAVTSTTFQSSGISPLSRDLLRRKHNGIANCSLNSFSTLGGTWWGPWALFWIKFTYLILHSPCGYSDICQCLHKIYFLFILFLILPVIHTGFSLLSPAVGSCGRRN